MCCFLKIVHSIGIINYELSKGIGANSKEISTFTSNRRELFTIKLRILHRIMIDSY